MPHCPFVIQKGKFCCDCNSQFFLSVQRSYRFTFTAHTNVEQLDTTARQQGHPQCSLTLSKTLPDLSNVMLCPTGSCTMPKFFSLTVNLTVKTMKILYLLSSFPLYVGLLVSYVFLHDLPPSLPPSPPLYFKARYTEDTGDKV